MAKRQRPLTDGNRTPGLVLFLLSFLFGSILGQVCADKIPDATLWEIHRYLLHFLQNGFERQVTVDTFFSLLWCYFRYPLIAVLFGYSTIGVLVLPAVFVVFSFFLSFSICCFYAALGSAGILFAAAAIGLRCVVILFCLLRISLHSFRNATLLAGVAFGRGRRVFLPQSDCKRSLKFVGKILLVLCLCVFFDLIFSPWILSCVFSFSSI